MTTGSNWVQHSSSRHRRLCARPGCGAPAAATLRFQPTQREAWLVALEEDAARTEGDLCARHAAGLVLPRGWQLHNNLPTADQPPDKQPPPARRSQSIARARRRRTSTAVQLPGIDAVAAPDTDPQPEVRRASRPSAPSAPLVPDATPAESEALAETLDAQTPLLQRAFRNVKRSDGGSTET